jgi:hypothetical protein
VNRNILNSKGVHVGTVARNEIFGLKGSGHLSDADGAEMRLDKATDKLFPLA